MFGKCDRTEKIEAENILQTKKLRKRGVWVLCIPGVAEGVCILHKIKYIV